MDRDVQLVAAKSAPAAAGISYALTGLPWAELAAAVTFFYILAQMYFLFRDKWWRDRQKRKADGK
jgi:hypothetical protein